MKYQTVILEKKERIATLTLNRPDRLNALNEQMIEDLIGSIGEVEEDQDVRVLVLTGAGRAFCSGGDMVDLEPKIAAEFTSEAVRQYGRHVQKIILGLHRLSKPTVAMVNGVAIGGGFDIALACDIRVGSENAKFIGYTHVGLISDLGGTWLLPRIIGMAKAAEFTFTGEPIEAKEAEKIGLLNKLVPASELETKTMELARKIAKGPAIAIRLDKLQLYKGLEMDLEAALEFEIACSTIAVASQDYREALAAFAEKRKPEFEGR